MHLYWWSGKAIENCYFSMLNCYHINSTWWAVTGIKHFFSRTLANRVHVASPLHFSRAQRTFHQCTSRTGTCPQHKANRIEQNHNSRRYYYRPICISFSYFFATNPIAYLRELRYQMLLNWIIKASSQNQYEGSWIFIWCFFLIFG